MLPHYWLIFREDLEPQKVSGVIFHSSQSIISRENIFFTLFIVQKNKIEDLTNKLQQLLNQKFLFNDYLPLREVVMAEIFNLPKKINILISNCLLKRKSINRLQVLVRKIISF